MEGSAKPIYSNREDDPELREPINCFVIGLAERVDTLQDVEASGDFAKLAQLCDDLAGTARDLGYEPLYEAGSHVAEACRSDAPDTARKGLMQLTVVSRRIRLGHRGAA